MIPNSPSTELYTLGKGILSIAEFSGGVPGVYYDVGNCPAMTVEVTQEKLAHYSARTGTKSKDKSVILITGYDIQFSLEEISIRNLKLYLRGTSSQNKVYANQALDKEYALKFVTDNPAGPNETWYFWKVDLSPNGPFSLIGDEWSTLSFSGEGLTDVANHPSSEYFDIWYVTTTSTSTSSSSSSSTCSTLSTTTTA
jgi:hypothetical protein